MTKRGKATVAVVPTAQPHADTGHGLPGTEATAHGRVILLSPLLFVCLWFMLVTIAMFTGMFCAIVATVYITAISLRGGYMTESAGLLPVNQLPIVAASYVVSSLVFLKTGIKVIHASIKRRQFVFKITVSTTGSSRDKDRPKPWWKRVAAFWAALFKEGGLLEITPETFEFLFLLREIIEVITQSYQAYKCSKLISERWINNFYVATLALNCWASPWIHWRNRHEPAMQRFLYLSSDVALDFISTLIVPLCIIFSVVLRSVVDNFAMSSGDMEYAFDVPYDDVYFVNLVKASQQIFTVTWLDFVTKMMPLLSMSTCLDQIVDSVRPRAALRINLRSRKSVARVTVVPLSDDTSQGYAAVLANGIQRSIDASRKAKAKFQWLCESRFVRWLVSVNAVHVFFFFWGFLIVGFHLEANMDATTTNSSQPHVGCKASSQPWLVSKFSCTVLEVNCYRHGFTGEAHEISSALDRVDAQSVSLLLISHCPRLYMPAQLQSLTNLMYLEVSNSTVVQWGDDAALINQALPGLQYLNLNRINFTESFPRGLQAEHFPHKLRDITIAASNITTLPSDLHGKWTRLLNLYIERTAITQLPSTIALMNPDRLSLLGNPITSIPDDYFTTDGHYQVVSVARTQLTKWPVVRGDLKSLYLVLMDYTEIEELPQWLIDEGKRRQDTSANAITVSAGGSAYCRKLQSIARLSAPGLLIVCRPKLDQEIEACPLTVMQHTRAP